MIPQEAIDLILESEGIDQPSRWPGGDSGITLGYGYDIGAGDGPDLVTDWGRHMTPEQIHRLSSAIGLTGERAAAVASHFRDILINSDDALEVFTRATLPKYESQTKAAFPGVAALPPLAVGALVSLAFNRGTGMGDMTNPVSWSRRREMREIRDTLALLLAGQISQAKALGQVAQNLWNMRRLWIGTDISGLVLRREREAAMVLRAIP